MNFWKIATFFPKKGRGWGVKGGLEIFRKFIHFRADSLPLLLDNISQIFYVYFSDLASCFLLHILFDISNSCNIKKGSASFPHGCGVKVLLLRDILGQQLVSSMKAGIENRINKSALVIFELELNASVLYVASASFLSIEKGSDLGRWMRRHKTETLREGWLYKNPWKSWHCRDWLDPSPPQSWHSGGFDEKNA